MTSSRTSWGHCRRQLAQLDVNDRNGWNGARWRATRLRCDAIAADSSGMPAKYVGLTVAATGFAVAFAAVFGRRPALLRGREVRSSAGPSGG